MTSAYQASHDRPNLRRDLKLITADGLAWSVMVGCGETYLAAMVLALGLGELAAGLVASIPLVCGATLQLISPFAVHRLGSHRKWVLICAFIQAMAFVPLMLAAIHGSMPTWAVFLAVSFYWAGGWGAAAGWNTWVGTLVPRRIRTRYFALRNRAIQATTLVALTTGAALLDSFERAGHPLMGFMIAFGLATLCRLISCGFLWRQSEPTPMPEGHRVVPLREMLGRFRGGRDGRLLGYMLMVQMAVQISGPFFNPYMLAQLEFHYWSYLGLIAVAYVSKIGTMHVLGTSGSRLGAQTILRIGGVGMVPLSAMWIVSDSYGWLMLVQVAAGCLWGFYEFATFLLLLEHVAEHERTSVSSMYHFAYAAATVIGSMIGAAILKFGGETRSAYLTVFAISGVVRLLTLGPLSGLLRLNTAIRPVVTETLSVRPNVGSVGDPILSASEVSSSNVPSGNEKTEAGQPASVMKVQ